MESAGELTDVKSAPLGALRQCPACEGRGGGIVAVGHPTEPEPDWLECDRCDGITGWQIMVGEHEVQGEQWAGLLDVLSERTRRLQMLEAIDPQSGHVHETWLSASREKLLEGLQFQAAVSSSLFAVENESHLLMKANRELYATLSELVEAAQSGKGADPGMLSRAEKVLQRVTVEGQRRRSDLRTRAGVCLDCGSAILRGEHLRSDLAPCYGQVIETGERA